MINNPYRILLLILLVFYSCDSPKDRESNTLLYWSSNNNREIDFTRHFIDQWNKDRTPKIKFQPVPEGQSSEEVILASVVGKTTPDIYANMWQGSVEMYAKAGVLIRLDTIKGFTDFIMQRCSQKTIEEITSSEGYIYQVPCKINPIMTLYMTNLLPA